MNKITQLGVMHRLILFLHGQSNIPTSLFKDTMALGKDIGYTPKTIGAFYLQMNALYSDVGVVTKKKDFALTNTLADVRDKIWGYVPAANRA